MGFKRDEVGIGLCSAAFQADGKGPSHGCKLRISGVYIPSCRTWRHALKTTINTTRPNAVALNNESRTTCIEYCHHTGCQKVNKKKRWSLFACSVAIYYIRVSLQLCRIQLPRSVFLFCVCAVYDALQCVVKSKSDVCEWCGMIFIFVSILPAPYILLFLQTPIRKVWV